MTSTTHWRRSRSYPDAQWCGVIHWTLEKLNTGRKWAPLGIQAQLTHFTLCTKCCRFSSNNPILNVRVLELCALLSHQTKLAWLHIKSTLWSTDAQAIHLLDMGANVMPLCLRSMSHLTTCWSFYKRCLRNHKHFQKVKNDPTARPFKKMKINV